MPIPLAVLLALANAASSPGPSESMQSRNARLLAALTQAEDDFDSVRRELGLSGAVLPGPADEARGSRSSSAAARPASAEHPRPKPKRSALPVAGSR